MKYLLCAVCCMLLSFDMAAANFNILDYGAVGDSITLNTIAIQKAIDAAHASKGGKVIVPKGYFLTGSVELKSGVNLHLDEGAVLLGSTNFYDLKVVPKSYMRAIVMASYQDNISITGSGTINGQGRAMALKVDSLFHIGELEAKRYNHIEGRPRFYMRSMLVVFVGCKHIEISGINMLDAASWVQHYDRCENLLIDGIKVYSDAYWNNDGIDISDSKNVRVRNCDVNSCDDGICLKSHYTDHIMEDVIVENCRVRSSASAIKFGTKSLGGFKNVTIRNIKVYDTFRSALAIESVDGGILENISVDSIIAVNTGNAIFIRLGQREKGERLSTLKNVTIKNMSVEVAFERPDYAYDLRGPELPFFHNTFPCSITGLPDQKVEDLSLENIQIKFPGRGNKALAYAPLSNLDSIPEMAADYPEFSMFGELPAWGFYMRHVDGIKMKNVSLSIDSKDYRPAFVLDDVKEATFENLNISGDRKSYPIVLHNSESVTVDKNHQVLKK